MYRIGLEMSIESYIEYYRIFVNIYLEFDFFNIFIRIRANFFFLIYAYLQWDLWTEVNFMFQ